VYATRPRASSTSRRRAAGVLAETHLVEFAAWEAIVETAKQIKADLIVMGTRGLTGLKHALLGSVAERTLRFAPCPVLTVKDESTA
jgi:nucleotide-binding universal stress UspA family protein